LRRLCLEQALDAGPASNDKICFAARLFCRKDPSSFGGGTHRLTSGVLCAVNPSFSKGPADDRRGLQWAVLQPRVERLHQLSI